MISGTNFEGMFWNAGAFGQDLDTWAVGVDDNVFYMFDDSNQSSVGYPCWYNNTASGSVRANRDEACADPVTANRNEAYALLHGAGWAAPSYSNFQYFLCETFNGQNATGQNATLAALNTSGIADLNKLFANCLFNASEAVHGAVAELDVASCTNFEYMFFSSNFAGNISGWNVANGTRFAGMFWNAQVFNSRCGEIGRHASLLRLCHHGMQVQILSAAPSFLLKKMKSSFSVRSTIIQC